MLRNIKYSWAYYFTINISGSNFETRGMNQNPCHDMFSCSLYPYIHDIYAKTRINREQTNARRHFAMHQIE